MNVLVKLNTYIDDEVYSTRAEGEVFTKNGKTILIYTEMLDGEAPVKNIMTIHPERVSLKRTGAVAMNQKFVEQTQTENVYHHPHGTIHMDTFTDKITFRDGFLKIDYRVILNGQEKREHRLELTFS